MEEAGTRKVAGVEGDQPALGARLAQARQWKGGWGEEERAEILERWAALASLGTGGEAQPCGNVRGENF